MMARKIFIEIGIGNNSFINTEVEREDGSEYRIRGCVPFHRFKSLYLRMWVGKAVYAVSTDRGFNKKVKDRKKFKLLFGLYGER